MASRLVSRYASLSAVTRATSRSSALKALMVAMPPRPLVRVSPITPADSLTAAYRGSRRVWYQSEPTMMTGMGRKARAARIGDTTRNVIPTNTTLAAVMISLWGPRSRNRSSWLTSSFSTAIRPPEVRSSK